MFSDGKPFPCTALTIGIMGDLTQQKRTIIACPVCGEHLPESQQPSISHCPSCDFNFDLLVSQDKPPVPQTEPVFIPNLVFWLLGTQIVISALLVVAFFFFAAPLYSLTPQLIAALQLFTILALGLFSFFLHRNQRITLIRISLMIIGVVSLPAGVLAISAGLAISPLKRRCIICRKEIKWTAHIECPHCQASMHRWGACRNKRLQEVAAFLEPETLLSRLEATCPNCHQLMQLTENERMPND
jgi:hypothetical protein